MNTNIISLKPLYDFVNDKDEEGRGLRTDTSQGKEYMDIARELIQKSDIPEVNGIYLFGKYDGSKIWKNIYLGESEAGKRQSLKIRIEDHLRRSKMIFWRTVMTKEQVLKELQTFRNGKYENNHKIDIRKTGSTHIVWAALPDTEVDIMEVERDLIEIMNPPANIQEYKPKGVAQDFTLKVVSSIRSTIHRNRDHQYQIDIMD